MKPGKTARLLARFHYLTLADDIAVHWTNVRLWQRGVSLPSRGVLADLAAATGIPLDTLMQARADDQTARRLQRKRHHA